MTKRKPENREKASKVFAKGILALFLEEGLKASKSMKDKLNDKRNRTE